MGNGRGGPLILNGIIIVLLAAAISAILIVVLYPWFTRHALAHPNERSSHRTPTPQGGGIAVVAATVSVTGLAAAYSWLGASLAAPLPAIAVTVVLMSLLGAADDLIGPLPVALRLILQTLLVAGVISTLPEALRVLPILPWWVERVGLLIGGLWFVNLVNFMDGIDLMTVVEALPIAAAIAVLGLDGALPAYGTVSAMALGGAVIGFAYFNRPRARIFLGDVGSLPIGLILGWLLLLVAGSGHVAAAIVLPLYYLADATITLMRRLVRRDRVFRAHRSHFYQRAVDNGFTVLQVVGRVLVVNVVLGALAIMTVIVPGAASDVAALCGGALVVAWLLIIFARGAK
jgi:UDP-N-acetylmuramyl pentapeptide phosphotransferase/UDP-N-acetylglucosamine-1-phosphate transferase